MKQNLGENVSLFKNHRDMKSCDTMADVTDDMR